MKLISLSSSVRSQNVTHIMWLTINGLSSFYFTILSWHLKICSFSILLKSLSIYYPPKDALEWIKTQWSSKLEVPIKSLHHYRIMSAGLFRKRMKEDKLFWLTCPKANWNQQIPADAKRMPRCLIEINSVLGSSTMVSNRDSLFKSLGKTPRASFNCEI